MIHRKITVFVICLFAAHQAEAGFFGWVRSWCGERPQKTAPNIENQAGSLCKNKNKGTNQTGPNVLDYLHGVSYTMSTAAEAVPAITPLLPTIQQGLSIASQQNRPPTKEELKNKKRTIEILKQSGDTIEKGGNALEKGSKALTKATPIIALSALLSVIGTSSCWLIFKNAQKPSNPAFAIGSLGILGSLAGLTYLQYQTWQS